MAARLLIWFLRVFVHQARSQSTPPLPPVAPQQSTASSSTSSDHSPPASIEQPAAIISRKDKALAGKKRDNSIHLNGEAAEAIADWQAFITETVGMDFAGIKLQPNDDGESYHVDHAVGRDANGNHVEINATLREIIERKDAPDNVTTIAAAG